MDLDTGFHQLHYQDQDAHRLKDLTLKPEMLISISGIVHLKGQPDKVIPEAMIVAREANMTSKQMTKDNIHSPEFLPASRLSR